MEHECGTCGKHWVDHTFWVQCPDCNSMKLSCWDADHEREDDKEIEEDTEE